MSQFPSNPPFGQQPGNAPSAASGAAPQQPGQPAWGQQPGAAPQQGQPAWGGPGAPQPGQYQAQQPGYYGAPAAPAGPAAISKLARLLVVIGLGVMALAELFEFIAMIASAYGPGAMMIIASLLKVGAWGTLTFGAWKLFDLVDAQIAKSQD